MEDGCRSDGCGYAGLLILVVLVLGYAAYMLASCAVGG
jgi:hypothetical protein